MQNTASGWRRRTMAAAVGFRMDRCPRGACDVDKEFSNIMHGRGAVEHASLGSSHETGVNDYKDVAAVRMSNLLSVIHSTRSSVPL